jgi:uncharacterized protein
MLVSRDIGVSALSVCNPTHLPKQYVDFFAECGIANYDIMIPEAHDVLRIAGDGVTHTKFNIFEHTIDEVRNEPRWKAAREASINLCEKCRQCKFMNACGGGYLPHRFSKKNGYDNPSVYCDDLYSMFENMQSVLEGHLYVSKPSGERFDLRSAPA